MAKKLDHEDAMELAVQLTCSYLGSSNSDSINAEDLILHYYRQIRSVEARLKEEDEARGAAEEEEEEEEEREAALAGV